MIKKIVSYIFIWTIALIFYTFLREFGQEVIRPYDQFSIFEFLLVHGVLGIMGGICFGSLQFAFEKLMLRGFNFGILLLLGSLGYFLAIMAFLSFAIFLLSEILEEELNMALYREILFSSEIVPFIAYCFLLVSFLNFLAELNKKFGPGNLRKMILGEFYKPKEENRIFMFLDLKSSTSIAEKLGHIKYSLLLQDCFKDIFVVNNYLAEVYQYVGDEVVLTWKTKDGLQNNNCIKAFIEYQKRLAKRREHYLKNYNIAPEFKAGLHMGNIIVAEVGEIKREIAYHGDTINTASRIQEECNRLGRKFLISEAVKEKLHADNSFYVLEEGKVVLKGKSHSMPIYSVVENI